ncbi:MAG TPA: cytochrome c [Acidobacteriaceae bacterium]
MPVARTLIGLGAMAAMLVLAGCRQDMQDEPKFFPQRGTTFYPDGRSVRPQVENTVARSQGDEDSYFYTGIVNGKEGDGLPIPLIADTMARGQERFNIYCAPCHSRVGNGNGMIVQRGYRPAGDFHTDRLRHATLGHFFAVITNGYGSMPDYAAQIAPQDRWAIAAYIRALELSQDATPADVPAGQHVEDLHQIARDQGMPPGFADPWEMPATAAVYGTPDGKDHGIPGQHITTAMDPATLHNILAHGTKASTEDLGRSTTSGPRQAQPDLKNLGKTAGPKQ